MEENDFKRIEQLVSSVVDARLVQHRKEVNDDFHHQVGIFTEDFQHKLQLVAEGHQMLAEKMDRMQKDVERVDGKVDAGTAGLAGSIRQLDAKLDAVSSDLAAHRADTEGHKRGYAVSEP
jgi:outer membrane murein-binding lipoprotein Lpp